MKRFPMVMLACLLLAGGPPSAQALAVVDPPGDTIGYLLPPGPAPLGGWGNALSPYPNGPLGDQEVDLRRFTVIDDCNGLNFQIDLAEFPGTTPTGIPPTVQVAIDYGTFGAGGTTWFDPLGLMLAPNIGINAPAQFGNPVFDWELLITTDVLAVPPVAYIHIPGFAGPLATIPLVWTPSAATPPNSIITFTLPWGGSVIRPPQGTKYAFTVMSAHGVAGGAPYGPTSAPGSDPDDVITTAGGPLLNSTANELGDPATDIPPLFSTDYQTNFTFSGCTSTTVTLNLAAEGVSEAVGTAQIAVSLTQASLVIVRVDYTTNDGSATQPGDYTDTFGTLIFSPGQTLKFIPVPIINDSLDEIDETFTVTLSNPVNAYLGITDETVTILDDDAPPVASISPVAQNVLEAGGNATFTVTLSTTSSLPITVNYQTSNGTAVEPDDYTLTSGMLTFAPGEIQHSVQVPIISDLLGEPDETFTVDLLSPVNVTLGAATQTTTIIDDDPFPDVTMGSPALSIAETGGTINVPVQLSAPSSFTVTVDYITADGTAQEPGDYDSATGTVTFLPGVTSQNIVLTINDDLLDENDETFTVTLVPPVANATISSPSVTTITILDNDPSPNVRMVLAALTVNEAVGTAIIQARLTVASGRTVTVDYTTSDGTAIDPDDYGLATGTVTFLPGETIKDIPINIVNDLSDEPAETFTVTLIAPVVNASLVAPLATVVTINDNDPPPTVSVASAAYSVNEGDGTAFISVQLTAPSGFLVSVQFSTSNGSAVEPGDYGTTTGMLTFQPGEDFLDIPVAIVDDLLDEASETFTLTLSGPVVNGNLGAPLATVVTILDNDPPPTVSMVVLTQNVSEGDGTILVTVQLSAPSGLTVSVNYATSNGSALQPGDYGNATGTLTFPPGTTTQDIPINIVDDLLNEDPEDFTVALIPPQVNGTIAPPSITTVTIADNDPPPVIGVSVAVQLVSEGAGSAAVTIELSTPSGRTVTVDYATADDTAFQVIDYTNTSGTLLTFLPGEVSKIINVPIINDFTNESLESFTFNLSNAVNATPGLMTQTIQIGDDDGVPTISISAAVQAVDEAVGNAVVTVNLSTTSSQTITVDYMTFDGSAAQPGDYTQTTGQIVFLPGESQHTVPVPIINDLLDEADEDFTFNLFNQVNASLGLATQIITIQDNDSTQANFTIAAQSIDEGLGPVVATVELTTTATITVTLNYNTANGTATQPADYTFTSGLLVFLPGQRQHTISVPIINDLMDENNETFTIRLSPPVNAVLGPIPVQTVTILDNDGPTTVSFAVNSVFVSEGTANALVQVKLAAPSGVQVDVGYFTTDGTALQPGDYITSTGTVTFLPGETLKSFLVPITNDLITEPSEDFTVSLGPLVNNGVIGAPSTIPITIQDDDAAPTLALFLLPSQTVPETVGTITADIFLSGPWVNTITIDYATIPGTAIAPDDYTFTSGQLVFLPGEVSKQISVPITDDFLQEPAEDFTIVLSNPVEVTIYQGVHTVTITDDDPPPGPYGTKEQVFAYKGEGRNPGQMGHITHDSLGNVHAAYYEAEKGDLKYARGLRNSVTGSLSWAIQTVDFAGDVGRYCDIITDLNNNPVISYYDATNRKLKIAWDKDGDGTFEQNGIVFGVDDFSGFEEITTVDKTVPNVGTWTSIECDALNRFHVSYKDETNGKLRYAFWDSSAWFLSTINTSGSAEIAGKYSCIVVDKNQPDLNFFRKFIVYQDERDLDLEVVGQDPLVGPDWMNYPTPDPYGDTGLYIDAALHPIDPNLILISYQDAYTTSSVQARLKLTIFAEFGGFNSTTNEIVESCSPMPSDPCPVDTLIGDWGYYTSLAIDGNGLPAVAHYDSYLGDLLIERRTTYERNPPLPPLSIWEPKRRGFMAGDVGRYTSSSHSVFVDPATLVSQDLIRTSFYDASRTAFRMMTTADDLVTTSTAPYVDGAKVGEYSSVGLDSLQRTVLAYYDDARGSLFVTRRSGFTNFPWESPFLVDDSTPSRLRPGDRFNIQNPPRVSREDFSQTGPGVSMVVDPSDVIHLAYYDRLRRELNFSVVDYGTSTTLRVGVDEGPERGEFASLAMTSGGTTFTVAYYQAFNPNVYNDPLGNGPRLRVATGDGFTSGTWRHESADNFGDVGRYCSAVYDSANRLHVAYYDATNHNLKYVRRAGLGWEPSIVVDGSPNVAGLYTSIAINPITQQPAISYYDLTDSALKYVEFTGSFWQAPQTVDELGDVGLYGRLAFDPIRKIAVIVYYDATFESLKVATKNILSQTWNRIETIETGGVGVNPSLVLDPLGYTRIAYYGQQKGDLYYRQGLKLPLSAVGPLWTIYD